VRVVSLVPSVTETLLAWGVTPVAVTRFCEQPDLPHAGGTKDPDIPAIVDLAPDLVVMCDEENRVEDAEALRSAGLAIHVMTIESVDAVAPALRQLAEAVGAPDVDASDVDGPDATSAPTASRRAFVPIWRRPWMSINASTYGSSLLASIGIDNVCAGANERYPTVTLDDVRALAPDVVLAPSEPYPFGERHRAEMETVAPVEFVDGQDLFWWGVRTPRARRRLLQQLDRSAG
jgi:ABC-type Fe3+-hydroxamate transport system substrate-binding protein